MLDFFKKPAVSFMGVDIGTTGMRIVELKKEGEQIILKNYGCLESDDYLSLKFSNALLDDSTILSHEKIVNDLSRVIKEMGISAEKISMSIPISSSFSALITLPLMAEGEIQKAINFEAKKYIPVSLEDVNFGWSLISENKTETKVIIVAIPRDVIMKYSNIAQALSLDLFSLETEAFSLTRSLVDGEKGIYTIVDIGSKTTGITLSKNGAVISSHSISSVGGMEITRILSKGLDVGLKRAESLKRDVGLNSSSGADGKVSEIMKPVVSVIVSDIKKINEKYLLGSDDKINKIILTGGSANLPGIAGFIEKELEVKTELGNPWKNIVYDERLSKKINEMGASFSIAIGLALKGFEI